MAGFGGAIKLTGESDYRRALNLINQNLKEVASEMKLVTSQYDQNDKSSQAVAAKTDALSKKLQEQTSKLELLKGRYSDMLTVFSKNETEHNKLINDYNTEKAKLDELAKTLGTTSQEYKDQEAKVEALSKEVDQSTVSYEKSEKAMSAMRTEINKTEAECNTTAKEMDELGKETDDAGKDAKTASDGFTVFKGVLADLAANVIQKAVGGMKDLAKNVMATGAGFESAMSQVAATMGVSVDSIENLSDFAREMGETTQFSATEAAQALNYMALAGYDAEKSMQMLPVVLNLAAAGGMDLATASDMVTDAQSALGLTTNETVKMVDQMAKAASKTNTSVAQLGEGYLTIGATARNLKGGTEELSQVLGLLADNGIKASEGGTHLRNILLSLQKASQDGKIEFEDFSLAVYDADGNMRGLDDIVGDLAKGLDGMTQESKDAMISGVFNKTDLAAVNALIGTSKERWDEVRGAISNASGAASDMANTMMDNVEGQMTLLKSKVEGIFVTIYEKSKDSISRALDTLSAALDKIDWDKVADAAGKAIEGIADGLEWIIDHSDIVLGALKGIAVAFVTYKAVSIIGDVVNAFEGLMTTVKAGEGIMSAFAGGSGIGLVVAAIAGLSALAITLGKDIDKNIGDKDGELKKRYDEVAESMDKSAKKWEELKTARDEYLYDSMNEMDYLEDLYKELQLITDENGHVKDGYQDRAKFIADTLSEKLGLEIQLNGDIIEGYKEIQRQIGNVIEAQRAQIILDSQKDLYAEAMNKKTEALLDFNKNLGIVQEAQTLLSETEANIAKKREELNEAMKRSGGNYRNAEITGIKNAIQNLETEKRKRENNLKEYQASLEEAKGRIAEYYYNIQTYEDNAALYHEGKYNEMNTVTWEQVNLYADAADAKKAQLQDEIAAEKSALEILKRENEKFGDDRYKDQIESSKLMLEAKEQELKDHINLIAGNSTVAVSAWTDYLSSQIDAITGKRTTFRDAGDGLIQMYVDGVKTGIPRSETEMDNMMRGMLDAVGAYDSSFVKAGKDVVSGVEKGIKDKDAQSGVYSAVSSFGSTILNRLKNSLQEKSPSKATAEMGAFLDEGLRLGIESGEEKTLKTVSGFGKSILGALSGELSTGVNVGKINMTAVSQPQQEGSTKQYGEMVSAFKKALESVSVELNDYEVGKFVDKTVTQLVYA